MKTTPNQYRLKQITRILAFAIAGFVGGALAPWLLGWVRGNSMPAPGDAISIANTYIVFTTIIFVGTTLILAMAGYVFTQQFAETKELQAHHLFDELREKIRVDEKLAIALVDEVLENSDVKRHIDDKFQRKLDELLREKKADADRSAAATSALAAQLSANGNK